MFRIVTIAAMVALALPDLAMAQQPQPHPRTVVRPGGGGGPPPGARAVVRPGPVVGGPRGGGPHVVGGAQFSYRGHNFNRVHLAPFVYPAGWSYRRWAVGAVLPPLFLVPAYYYADWATLGLAAPEPGFQWVRYGPDLVLVNVATGQIVDVVYGAFY